MQKRRALPAHAAVRWHGSGRSAGASMRVDPWPADRSTPMTHDEFVSLVKRLERDAARHPLSYQMRAIAFGALAYAYVALALAMALAVLALVIWAAVFGKAVAVLAKIIWALIAFTWAVLRSLWVRFDRPQGLALE